jgi:peptide/nickel transport system permease protein
MTRAAPDIAVSAAPPGKARSLWSDALHRLGRDRTAMACFGVIVIYALIAIIAPLALSDWETDVNFDNLNAPPSWEHPLGTDTFGRGVLGKTLLGAHVSMTVAFFSNIIAVPLGMILGAIAGYYGGWLDDLIVWLYTTLAAIPSLIRLIALKFAFQEMEPLWEGTWAEVDFTGLPGLVLVLTITSWIGTCRLVRAETMKLRELDYIMAARAAGRWSPMILLRHVLPNVFHIGIITFSLGFVGAISAEVILSYLQLGVKDMPSWGSMISQSLMDLISGRWWELVSAVVATFIIVLAWNIFGDRLRDALDPRLRKA